MGDALDKFPQFGGKPHELAMLCALLHQRHEHADALAIGAAAVAVAGNSIAVRDVVTRALSSSVPKFHIPMLRDRQRNSAYATAIAKAIKPGMRVLEIGTGAGLLAMIAARAGAQVVTCEENPMIAAAAVRIIAENGLSDSVRVVSKRSTALTIPEDLPGPADLLIHEIFGSGLFDEGADAAVTDARRRLLKPNTPSVPPRAAVRCRLVREGRSPGLAPLSDVEGFDLSSFALLSRTTMGAQAFQSRDLEPVSENYTGLTMNYDREPPFGPRSETIAMASGGGRIDGLAQWIAIDFESGNLLENNPFVDGPPSSWGARYLPLATPLESKAGDIVEVSLRHRDTALLVDMAMATTSKAATMVRRP